MWGKGMREGRGGGSDFEVGLASWRWATMGDLTGEIGEGGVGRVGGLEGVWGLILGLLRLQASLKLY